MFELRGQNHERELAPAAGASCRSTRAFTKQKPGQIKTPEKEPKGEANEETKESRYGIVAMMIFAVMAITPRRR